MVDWEKDKKKLQREIAIMQERITGGKYVLRYIESKIKESEEEEECPIPENNGTQ